MSLKYEQFRSLVTTRELLSELLTVDGYPKTKKEMRARVSRCLRHYPPLDRTGAPMFSRDEFECPEIINYESK